MNIIIVEDEIMIQDGLKKLLHKISPDYQVTGIAGDGREALELMERNKPDLVITDVRMPHMDGLEMLEEMQRRSLNAKVIILSAYSDFEYARKAMRFGVSEYLLKPVAVNELRQTLQFVEMQIDEQRRQRENPADGYLLDSIFYNILSDGKELKPETNDFLEKEYGIEQNQKFLLVLFYLGNSYEITKKELHKKISHELQGRYDVGYSVLSFPKERSMAVVIYSFRDAEELKKWFEVSVLSGRGGADSTGWAEFQGILEFGHTLQRLKQKMDFTVVFGSEVMICYPQILKIQTKPYVYPRALEQELRAAVCLSETERIKGILQSFENSCFSGDLYSPEEIKKSYVRFIWNILGVAKEIIYSKYQTIEQQVLFDRIMSAITRDELSQVLNELYDRLFEEDDLKSDNYLIQRTKNMVHEFYAQGITLEEIAIQLKITPEYLSTQFRMQCQVNFSTYIKEYRVQKAKELLLGSRLKLYEVAQAVGYSDARYFGQVFKAVTGESPNEYRKRHE